MTNDKSTPWYERGGNTDAFNQPSSASLSAQLELMDRHDAPTLKPDQQERYAVMRKRYEERRHDLLEKQNEQRAQRIETAKVEHLHDNKGLHPAGHYPSPRLVEDFAADQAARSVALVEARELNHLEREHHRNVRGYVDTCQRDNNREQQNTNTHGNDRDGGQSR